MVTLSGLWDIQVVCGIYRWFVGFSLYVIYSRCKSRKPLKVIVVLSQDQRLAIVTNHDSELLLCIYHWPVVYRDISHLWSLL